jgi:hypothetical protein
MLTLRSAIKMKKLFGILVILLAGLALVQTASAAADVIINEFAATPSSGNDWVELHNKGDAPQVLTGWTIKDDSATNSKIADLTGTLNAGEYLVVEVSNRLTATDEITLNDNSVPAVVIDSVSYGSAGDDLAATPVAGESAALFTAWEYGAPSKDVANTPTAVYATSSVADDATVTSRETIVSLDITGGASPYTITGTVIGGTIVQVPNTNTAKLTVDADGTYDYVLNVMDKNGKPATTISRTVIVDLASGLSATNQGASVILAEDVPTIVDVVITITNTGEKEITLSENDFSSETLLFQGLENPTTYIFDSETSTYREGYTVDGTTVSFSLPATKTLAVGKTMDLTVTYVVPAEADIEHYGVYKGLVSITDTTKEATATSIVSLTLNPITGKSNKLDIDVEYEDEPFFRTQEVKIGVNIDNGNSEKAKSIKVTLAIPELNIEETSSKFTLDDGEDNGDDLEFTFDLEDDVEEGNYPIYIYVTGNSETSSGADLTIENYKYGDTLEVSVETDDLIVETATLSEDDYKAGDNFVATVKVRNIGTSDQEDVRVRFVCDDLGISKLSDITDDLKDGKSLTKTFTLKVPTTAKDGSYICTAEILYEDVDEQQDDEDIDDHLTENIVLVVTGGLGQGDSGNGTSAKASITGASTTTANIGDVKKFTLNLKNEGTSGSATYTLQMEGYSNWAESAKVEPATLTIPAGTSVPFYAYLTPATGANGAQTATVAAYVGTEKVASQALTVTVNGGTGIQVDDLGNSITGAVTGFNLDVPTAIIISSVVAGVVLLGAVYMFTLAKKL